MTTNTKLMSYWEEIRHPIKLFQKYQVCGTFVSNKIKAT